MFWKLDKETHTSNLFKGARLGKLALVKRALAAGVAVDEVDGNGRSALCVAAKYNQTEVARFLIASGADLNFRTETGRTPIFEAVHGGGLDCGRLLIEHGARLDLTDALDYTPLAYAHARGQIQFFEILEVKSKSE